MNIKKLYVSSLAVVLALPMFVFSVSAADESTDVKKSVEHYFEAVRAENLEKMFELSHDKRLDTEHKDRVIADIKDEFSVTDLEGYYHAC
ncbi:hypothetical protein [Paenibacillus tianmuensis]|uniref:hypothetical protein n=1 Tax=Paenibacillus tianmuensis TaxID=624147 RepID=UPI000B89C610|nr:hypothetical protein [Paenibacillus tianmuensis]